MANRKNFKFETFHPKAPKGEQIKAGTFTGSEEEATQELQKQLDTGDASLGQLLEEDGKIITHLVPRIKPI